MMTWLGFTPNPSRRGLYAGQRFFAEQLRIAGVQMQQGLDSLLTWACCGPADLLRLEQLPIELVQHGEVALALLKARYRRQKVPRRSQAVRA